MSNSKNKIAVRLPDDHVVFLAIDKTRCRSLIPVTEASGMYLVGSIPLTRQQAELLTARLLTLLYTHPDKTYGEQDS